MDGRAIVKLALLISEGSDRDLAVSMKIGEQIVGDVSQELSRHFLRHGVRVTCDQPNLSRNL